VYVHNAFPTATDSSGLKRDPCDDKTCEKCVKDALNDDDILKELLKLAKEKNKFGFEVFKKGCKPDASCEKCDGIGEGGTYKKGKIVICYNGMQLNIEGQMDTCAQINETLRHEYLHQLVDYLKADVGGDGDCETRFCDEVNAYRDSGMCKKGSAYWTIKGGYKDEDAC